MTLILNILTGNRVIQASDRCLTNPDGTVVDDEANKAICVVCTDAIFSIGYTGLASLGRKRTDEWIADYLTQLNLNELPLSGIVDSLESALKNIVNTLSIANKNKALSIIFLGFLGDNPFMLQLSNCEDERLSKLTQVDKDFHIAFVTRKKKTPEKSSFFYTFHGWEPAVDRTIIKHLERLNRKRFFHNSENLSAANEAVSLIRVAARNPMAANRIGRSCMSVVIQRNSTAFETRYHPEILSPQLYAPHLIVPGAAYKDIQIWTGEEEPKWWTDMINKSK